MNKEQDPFRRVLTTDYMCSKVLQAGGNALDYPDDMFRGCVEAYLIVIFAKLNVLDAVAKAGDVAGVDQGDDKWRDVAPSAPMGTVHVGKFLRSTLDEVMKIEEGGAASAIGGMYGVYYPEQLWRTQNRGAAMRLVNEWIGAAISDNNPQPF